MSPFAEIAPMLLERGHVIHPIAPGTKVPGTYCSGQWTPQIGWTDRKQVFPSMLAAWMRWPNAGIGVLTGRGLICIDIDREELIDPIIAILPPSRVQKKGRKGVSLFFRGNTEKIRSRNYRTADRVSLLDLLAEGKQTVLPPSIHPDTGEPYYWSTDDTLEDTPIGELTELPDDIAEQIGEVLKPFGYDPDRERAQSHKASEHEPVSTASSNLFREINALALASLPLWVPALGFQRFYRAPDGYKAVAPWRSSGSGRPFSRRGYKLSFVRAGIKDFGTGENFTPIDVVMKALNLSSPGEALNWLGGRVDPEWDIPPIDLQNGPETLKRLATKAAAK